MITAIYAPSLFLKKGCFASSFSNQEEFIAIGFPFLMIFFDKRKKRHEMITEDEIKVIEEMAEMYRAEFGEDERYNKIKSITANYNEKLDILYMAGELP